MVCHVKKSIKLMKGKLNVDTLFKFVSVLEMIEEDKLDQNEGSVQIGQILKKMYIDTALYESKIDNKKKGKDKKKKKKVKNISWEEFKQQQKVYLK